MSKDVYVDVRLKMHVKDRYNDSVCNYELEDGFALANIICKEIRGMEQFSDVYDVEVVRVGKLSPLVVSVPDDFLISDD